jgi:hypothetical protein
MIDTSLTGGRCRATKEIRSHQGLTRRFTDGTIQYDLENIGHHPLSVEWEIGVTDYVYPFEIEILDEESPVNINETGMSRWNSMKRRRVVTHKAQRGTEIVG